MSDGAVFGIETRRVRAISFATSTVLVLLTLFALFVFTRVTAYLDHEPIAGVQVEIVPRVEPRRPTARSSAPPPQRAVDTGAPPVTTDIPVDRAMFARTLRCFNLRPGQARPANCPPGPTPSQLEAAGGDFRGAPGVIEPPTPQNTAQVFAGIPPPCTAGFSPNPDPTVTGVQFCIRGGVVPQERARSPEAICESGGLGGPCRPPAFRADEVTRLQHTQ